MLGMKCGKKLEKYVADYVVLDLETTGVSVSYDQIVELSALKVQGGQVIGEFSTLVNPGRPIPLAASAVNGITDDMVADAPVLETVLQDFLEFVGDLLLVGHNIQSFDLRFLYREAERIWGQTVTNDYIDTLPLARYCLPGLSHHRLVDLAAYYHISTAGAHRALNDCYMNQRVFEALGKELEGAAAHVKRCPRCGQLMRKRNGRFGEFWGCGGYPACRYTENVR